MRIVRNLTILCLLSVNCHAIAENLPQQLKACAEHSADDTRLACYDAVSRGLAHYAELQFGRDKQTDEQGANAIIGTIARVREGAHGKHRVILSNGQVWRQTGSSPIIWKAGQQVKIERGALGSFLMRKRRGGRTVRVKRVD